MNLTRLMVLGTLQRHGPQHGHQIRRTAEVTNVSDWGGVSVGALYRDLRVMEGEGLVTAVRTERVGRRPARTVYEITDTGRLELSMLREQAITGVHYGTDPLGVALTFSGDGGDRAQLIRWLKNRRDLIALLGSQLRAEREDLLAKGHLNELEAAAMRRGELRVAAEITWHDEFAPVLAALPDDNQEGNKP
jgi:DNA-binding PadR family transcriptional regulator